MSHSPNLAKEVRPEFMLQLDQAEDRLAELANLGDEYTKMLDSLAWKDFKSRIVNRINNLDEQRDTETNFRKWRAISAEINILRGYLAEPQRIIQQSKNAKIRLSEITALKKEQDNG